MTPSFIQNSDRKKITSIIQQMQWCNETQLKINNIILQFKQEESIIEPEHKFEPIEKNKIDDIIRQFGENEVTTKPMYDGVAATITTYDDIQYDDQGYYVKANEISKIHLKPEKDKFIVIKKG